MLTPTDIHYVVGLLSKAAHPDNVEIELGDYVYDEAAESSRDVDVTIKVRNADSSISAFKGIEVKAHSRKLGSESVEQLIQKLADMPGVTHPAIVSASGYTKPAIRKAAKHRVELYELKTWIPSEGFDFFKCEPRPAVHTQYGWAQPPRIRINPMQKYTEGEQKVFLSNPPVFLADGSSQALQSWLHSLSLVAAKEFHAQTKQIPEKGVRQISANVTLKSTDSPYIVIGNSEIIIGEIHFSGIIELRVVEKESVHKALFKLGDSRPIAGCCVSDFGEFGLLGLLIAEPQKIELAIIPITDRNRKKIFRQKLSNRSIE